MDDNDFHVEEIHNGEGNRSDFYYTQGRERGKWVVKVIDSDQNIIEERLTAQDVWGMENRRVIVEFGPYNQPEEGSGGIFGAWLGMLSTDLNKFPITYDDWRKVPQWRKDDAWDYIQSKFYFDSSNENHKKFVMKSLSQKCKGVKTRLWNHFGRNTLEEAIEARPDFIPKEQWQDYVHLQFSEKTKLLKTGKRPSRGEIFVCSRQKADGSFVNETARGLSDKLKEKMTLNMGNTSGSDITTSSNDEFSQLFGAERPGRVRCVGLGPTPSTFFQHRTTSSNNDSEVIGLRNLVHDLEEKLEKMNGLEEKLEKMNELEDKLEKMNDALNRLASFDCNCRSQRWEAKVKKEEKQMKNRKKRKSA